MFRHIISQLDYFTVVRPVSGVERNTNPLGEVRRQHVVAEALKERQFSARFSQSSELEKKSEHW